MPDFYSLGEYKPGSVCNTVNIRNILEVRSKMNMSHTQADITSAIRPDYNHIDSEYMDWIIICLVEYVIWIHNAIEYE